MMRYPLLACLFTAIPLLAEEPAGQPRPIEDLQAAAKKFHSEITVPEFEISADAVTASVEKAIAEGNADLDKIGKHNPKEADFKNTFGALDALTFIAGKTHGRLEIIKNASTEAAMRDAATEGNKKIEQWFVSIPYRQDVYKAVKSVAAKKPALKGEDAKLLKETLRDYKRAGLDLPPEQQKEVERLRKELTKIETDFHDNIRDTKSPVKFTRAELAGAPEDFLTQKGVQTGDDEFTIDANVTHQVLTVMDNCSVEASRKRLYLARDSRTMEKNVPLFGQIIEIRDTIAQKLGYKSWADYQIEPKMAKNAATAQKFCDELERGLQPKFDAEIAELKKLKAEETGEGEPQVNIWDWRYFSEQLRKKKYDIDAEALRVFFPYQNVLEGMFNVYRTIFGIEIEPVTPPYKWVDDLRLYAVSDAKSGEPLGLFYLDMFPRDGKYNHFAEFGIFEGARLPDGTYQRPTVALICNFPPPSGDKPSLMAHDDVVTIFHEFGHAMHSILTRANYSRFSGTSVPRDFVEAPSQMLENWGWDKAVLDTFAADYRDPSKKIPAEILSKLREADLATKANFYRRQLSFALLDLAIHGPAKADTKKDVVRITNDILSQVFYPVDPSTAQIASFDHLAGGYDAGYYGYAWADAIAADLNTVFEKSPKKYFDTDTGKRLRDEIYAPGDSRDVDVSIEKFLGRKRSIDPFLKKIGITKSGDAKSATASHEAH
jgi:thimet oligopeptidase